MFGCIQSGPEDGVSFDYNVPLLPNNIKSMSLVCQKSLESFVDVPISHVQARF